MKLSVIIVNRNSCALLKQNLNSIVNAVKSIDCEIIVVDNASTDASLEMLADEFPRVQVIASETEQGVSKAKNSALKLCTGEYVFLVSVDSICVTGSLEKTISFMDFHKDAGGAGIRMITPQGRFLPESVHGITKPWIVFFKLTGFAKHLSKTRLYNRNRREWVEEFQVAEVDLLNSSCMMLRRSVLNETGLFDERFSKYGYDIDLSYRIRLAGFKNYYFPKAYIIKADPGDNTAFSWGHIRYFYGAMLIFAAKYLFKLPEINIQRRPGLISATYEA
jgi:GT2 family glycosyltransferase